MIASEILIAALVIFLINIPFGYWRGGTRRFSWQWYLAIHIPVPLIVLIRIYYDFGWGIKTYAYFVLAFFLGQLLGKILRKKRCGSRG
jgi:hypothetical protein